MGKVTHYFGAYGKGMASTPNPPPHPPLVHLTVKGTAPCYCSIEFSVSQFPHTVYSFDECQQLGLDQLK